MRKLHSELHISREPLNLYGSLELQQEAIEWFDRHLKKRY